MVVSIPPDGTRADTLADAAQRPSAPPVGAPLGRALRGIAFSRQSPTALLALFLTVSLSACAMQTTPDFDSTTWKSQRGAAPRDNSRGQMVAVLEKSLHTGMSRDDVVKLLGEPDSTDADTATDVYELGVAAYGVDEEFYEIQYQDGKIAAHRWARR
jgi:hypothetical protein